MNGNIYGVILVAFGLVVFGYAYNRAVEWARPRGYMEPYTALWVALGVAVTLVGAGVIDLFTGWNAFLAGALAFCCSGLFMIIGDAARYVQSISRIKTDLRRQYDETERLAEQSRLGPDGQHR